jgi:cation:H+ antiporter
MMVMALAAVVAGIAVLAISADQFVVGAARVALLRRVPSLVVGVVIIGFGTSTPELLVSALAALRGEPEIAVGNIVGSNIANLSLVLGIGAVIIPLAIASSTVKREAPLVVAAMVLFAATAWDGHLGTVDGLVLLTAMTMSIIFVLRGPAQDPIAADVVDLSRPENHRLGIEAGRTIAGLVGTVAAAQVLLWGAVEVASIVGLSSGFVGATLVAIGTSLPELVTVIQSARRRETDLIIGNLLGSNLFNALAVGGVVGVVGAADIDAPRLTAIGLPATIVVAMAAALAMGTGRGVSRREGVFLIVAYLALVALLL